MTSFQLRTRRDQEPVAHRPSSWIGSASGGSTIQFRHRCVGLGGTCRRVDLLKVAAAVYCADRLTVRPGTWT